MSDLDFGAKQAADEALERMDRELATVEPGGAPAPMSGEPTIERMMELAIRNNNGLEVIKELVALQNAQEDRRNKQEFERRFAAMQSAFTAIVKRTKGYDYVYSTLGELQEHFGPTIAEYGFSHYWTQETLERTPEGKAWKRITIHITGWGHERTNSFDVPPVDRTKQMSSVHALGAADTYGERYTFAAGYALPIKNFEDNDAQGINDEAMAKVQRDIEDIRKSPNAKECQVVFGQAWNAAKGDKRIQDMLKAARDETMAGLQP